MTERARGPVLAATLAGAAARFGDRTAIVTPTGQRVSYRGLLELSQRAGAVLAARGIRAGDLVALSLPAGAAYLATYLGLARLGATTVGVNRRLPDGERARIVDDLAPRALVTTAELDPGADVDTLHLRPPEENPDPFAGLPRGEDAPLVRPDPDRPVAVVLTSGSSGRPKGAVFTDRQLRGIQALDHGDGWDGGGPMLLSTEPAHVGVMTKLAWYLRSGATMHVLRHWRAEDALRVIVDERLPVIGAISAQVALLLRALDGHDVTHVRQLVVGGGPSPRELVERARAAFGAGYSIRYSSTESGGCGTATDPEATGAELDTVGRPRPGVEVEIRTEGGDPVVPGEVGVVHLRSPAVMARYHQDPARTAETLLAGGWLRTDDLGHLDDRGRLVLAGRRSSVYIRGGYNVHPERVEAALGTHPAVAAVAIVPRDDDVMGEIGVAAVVPRPDQAPPTLADLRDHAAARLARHELPEGLALVDALPRNATDKLDRSRLRALVAGDRADLRD